MYPALGIRDPILALDLGNHRAKAAVYHPASDTPEVRATLGYDAAGAAELRALLAAHPVPVVGICNVSPPDNPLLAALPPSLPQVVLSARTPGRVHNAYATPDTLGVDRWVAVNAARAIRPQGALLVLDFGTALTYDYVDAGNHYRGGAISPGLHMRFAALHAHTARLPLLQPARWDQVPLVGDSTAASILAGVQQAMAHEVAGMVAAYRAAAGAPLHLLLTGGDAPTFENRLNYANFVAPDLVLAGIELLTRELCDPSLR